MKTRKQKVSGLCCNRTGLPALYRFWLLMLAFSLRSGWWKFKIYQIFSSIKATIISYARMIRFLQWLPSHLGIYGTWWTGSLSLCRTTFSCIPESWRKQSAIQRSISEKLFVNTLAFVAVSIFTYVVLSAFGGSMVASRRYRKSPFASYHADFSRPWEFLWGSRR